MNQLTLESWIKPEGAAFSSPMGEIHLHINPYLHQLLESAEEELHGSPESEKVIGVSQGDVNLETPDECGKLRDCQFRVYLSNIDQRGQFHLVGHRDSDNSLVYSSAVLVDTLG
ncbi:hypothetical protein CI610_02347 [invertebrate metagenome]|uniref:Uncharacterized protein n=1 Tax=invertebrate metagenome TaxID=1711999 RepID=A0A2H9T687_9ZZZZ